MDDLWTSPIAITAFVAALVGLVGAFFAGIVSVITAWRSISQKVVAIEAHVNSQKTAAEGRETALKVEIAMLRELIVEKTMTAALLAQASAKPPELVKPPV